jgi:hypothetical protein
MAYMLEINFSGPYGLLPSRDEVPLLLADPAIWTGGVYLWTFLYNQAHRVNFAGVCSRSVAERHTEHLTDFLTGRQTFYNAADLAAGALTPVYRPGDGDDRFVAGYPALMSQLCAIRIFAAPFNGPEHLLKRLGLGIVAHFQQFGGRAREWLDNDPVVYNNSDYDEKLTVRIGRPAFIASMPDEMHL